MMQELLEALRLIRDHFADGFASLLAIAVVAPWLGVLLVLRRLPLLALAVPQMAGCGQAAAFFAFALLWTVDPAQPDRRCPPSHCLQFRCTDPVRRGVDPCRTVPESPPRLPRR